MHAREKIKLLFYRSAWDNDNAREHNEAKDSIPKGDGAKRHRIAETNILTVNENEQFTLMNGTERNLQTGIELEIWAASLFPIYTQPHPA